MLLPGLSVYHMQPTRFAYKLLKHNDNLAVHVLGPVGIACDSRKPGAGVPTTHEACPAQAPVLLGPHEDPGRTSGDKRFGFRAAWARAVPRREHCWRCARTHTLSIVVWYLRHPIAAPRSLGTA